MRTPTLAEIIKPEVRGNLARFARALKVSWTTAWRWCLAADHANAVPPPPTRWADIETYTAGRWKQPPGVGLSAPRGPRRKAA